MYIQHGHRRFGFFTVPCVIFLFSVSIFAQDNNFDLRRSPRTSFFPSYEEENRIQQRELERALETTLKSIPSISGARVHLSLNPGALWRGKQTPSSASVVLISENPSRVEKKEVKKLVSGAVSDVSENNISVLVYGLRAVDAPQQMGRDQAQMLFATDDGSAQKRILICVIVFLLGAATVVLGIGVARYVNRKKRL
jgi:type III secretory pathway lipoprotein EscJ